MPTLVDDRDTTNNGVATGNVLENDSTGAILRFVDGARIGPKGASEIIVSGTYGEFTFKPNGDYTYALYTGDQAVAVPPGATDRVSYKISDGSGKTDFGYLTIDVLPASTRPVAVDDFATIDEDGFASGNVLSNDFDPDGGTVMVSRAGGENTATANPNDFILKFVQPGQFDTVVEGKYGFLSIGRDGEFKYTLNAGDADTLALNGAEAVDKFQYRIYDDEFGTAPDAQTTDIGILHIAINSGVVAL
jgi:autoaggregation protein RapA/B/C